jgi:DNA-binding CsgD family transcriptional regulator
MAKKALQPDDPELLRIVGGLRKNFVELDAFLKIHQDPTPPPPPRLKEITPTEHIVWEQLAAMADENNDTIYGKLGMKKHNFDNHVNSLYEKLGVHKRTSAVSLWALYGKGAERGK